MTYRVPTVIMNIRDDPKLVLRRVTSIWFGSHPTDHTSQEDNEYYLLHLLSPSSLPVRTQGNTCLTSPNNNIIEQWYDD